MPPATPTRRPPYRLAAFMIVGLVVMLAVQLAVQVPKAVAAVRTR